MDEWRNYGLQTGDFKEAMKFVDKQYTDELELYQNTSRFYKDGGWIVGVIFISMSFMANLLTRAMENTNGNIFCSGLIGSI